MGDAHCLNCRTTELVFDHAACDTVCDTVCSEGRPVRCQNRCCDPDQSLISGFQTIATMCNRLGLVARVKGRACEILKKADQFYNDGRNQDAILAACLYIACWQEDSPRMVKEICSVANGATKKEIRRAKEYILEEQNCCFPVETGTINAADAMRRWNMQATKVAWEALQKSEKFEIRKTVSNKAAGI